MNPLIWLMSATPSADASLLGYTGLLNVPTAEVRQDLGIAFRWLDASQPLLLPPGAVPVNRTYSVVFPFLQFLEGTLSMVQVIGWSEPDQPLLENTVHRSFALKGAISPAPGLFVAAGIVDPVSVNFLNRGEEGKTHYGLTSAFGAIGQRVGPLSATLGWGAGDPSVDKCCRTKPFLDGIFGGADLALPGGLDLLVEYDGLTTNYGARWALPWGIGLQGGYVGGGWTAGLSLGVTL